MAITITWGGVYQIRNALNGKVYVGSAIHFRRRWASHRMRLRRGDHHSKHLQAAWNKYGETAFEFEVLVVCAKKDCVFFEQRAFDVLVCDYNICRVAGSPLGVKHSTETRRKLSEIRKGKPLWSEAQKKAISDRLMGHSVSTETREKLRQAKLGKPGPRRGKKASPETRKRMSEAKIGIRIKGRIVHNTSTGEVFNSLRAAAEAVAMKPSTLGAMLRGQNLNTSPLEYL